MRKWMRKGAALLCLLSVIVSGVPGQCGLFASAASENYNYYVHVSSSGDDNAAEVNSSRAFHDIQLAYDALICKWVNDGGNMDAKLGIILDSDISVDAAFVMGMGEFYGRAHDGTDQDVQTGLYTRINVNTKAIDDTKYNDYSLTLDGGGHIVSPNPDQTWSTFAPNTIENGMRRSALIVGSAGGNVTVTNLKVDGQQKDVSGLYLYNNSYHDNAGIKHVAVNDCTFENLCIQQATQFGAGIGMGTAGTSHNVKCELEVNRCTFRNNKLNTGATTYAGALYAGSNTKCTVRNSTFDGNEANTGGAVAVYRGLLDIDGTNTFSDNTASQRGGTIHDAGTVILKDLTSSNFKGGSCGQFGGAITVISNPDFTGRLVLDGCEITGFSADNAGGGIYIYSNAELYLYGGSSVTGNTNEENVDNELVQYPSNIHTASSSAKVYVGAQTGKTGISTTNPTEHKVLVYSADESVLSGLNKAISDAGGTQTYGAYSMESSFSEEDFKKITYDSDVYSLVQDTDVPDDMWLELQAGSYIFWNLNIPGIASPAAIGGNPGSTVNAPQVSAQMSSQGLEYTFEGWYTSATGGQKVTSGTYPETGVQVYYAHWNVKNSGGGDVPEPQNKYFTVFFDQNYDGGGITSELVGDTTLTLTVTYDDGTTRTLVCHLLSLGFSFPDDPVRSGYEFAGWSLTSDNSSGLLESSYQPEESVTLYAIWKVHQHTLTWDAGKGAPSSTTQQDYGSVIETPQAPAREGYEFSGWYRDPDGTVPLTDGERVTEDATYYAKWTPLNYLITWNTDYTNGSVTSVHQHYDEELIIQQDPVRYGYEFAGWYTGKNGTGVRAESYGTVREDVTFYAYWVHETMDYDVVIQWDDFSDNDSMRPEEVTVALVRNGIETGETYTFTESDVSPLDQNAWVHTFKNLAVSDDISAHYVYSVAVKSSVSDEYTYRGDFTSNAYAGYIYMTHSLVLTDLPVYLRWEDESNNDGYRPASVNVTLLADGEPADTAEFIYREGKYQMSRVSLTGDQDTWTYTFQGFQKYRQKDGRRGETISYSIRVEEEQKNDLEDYQVTYSGSGLTAILTHKIDTLSKVVTVSWDDNHNQDHKRPANIVVQLYGNKEPIANKYVTLSDANEWTYRWDDLPKFDRKGKLIHYEAYVVSTLIDYTASTSGMAIRMTYVPKSTSISAYVTWTDESDADGLRPDYLEAELYADGQPTGDVQILSENSSWRVYWENYPVYSQGAKVEYTFQIAEMPDGYEASYYGIYDTSGLSAVMTHLRIKQDLVGTIHWEDHQNQASARPARVSVQLYADGEPVRDSSSVFSEESQWQHTWTDYPVYRDGGVKIIYSIKETSDIGRYTSLSAGMDIEMYYEAVTADISRSILWQDGHDSDGKRPEYLSVILTVNGERSVYSTVVQDNGTDTWSVVFEGFPKYASDGSAIEYGVLADPVPQGYSAIYTSGALILTRDTDTVTVGGDLIWNPAFDSWNKKPQSMEIALWGYSALTDQYTYLGASTAKASENWEYSFRNMPVSDSATGTKFTGYVVGFPQMTSYYAAEEFSEKWQHYVSASYDDIERTDDTVSMNVYLEPNENYDTENTTSYTAGISWADNGNANHSRSYGEVIRLTGRTSGSEIRFSYAVAETDFGQGNSMEHTFQNIPVKDAAGEAYEYQSEVTEIPVNYALHVQKSDSESAAFTLVNVGAIEVTAVWLDERDSDGRRPEEMTLQLYSDNAEAEKYAFSVETAEKTETDAGGADVWTYRFAGIPVWSDYNTDRETRHVFYLSQNDVQNLEDNGYSVDYRSYQTDANAYSGENETYFLYLSRTPETSDIETTLTWSDDANKEGLRPSEVTASLYADCGDGEGFQPTGREQVIAGDRNADQWTAVWEDMRMYDNRGTVIIYTLVLKDIRYYRPEYSKDSPDVKLVLDKSYEGSSGSDDENGGESTNGSNGSGSGNSGGGSGFGGTGSGSSGSGNGSGSGSSGGGSGFGGSGSGSSGSGSGSSSGSSGSGNGSGGSGSGSGTGGDGAGANGSGSGSASGSTDNENGGSSDGFDILESADVSELLNTSSHIAYLKGYPDGAFGADDNMTRAEVAQMFYNLLNNKEGNFSLSFSDVDAASWYAEPVAVLSGIGIITGYPDQTFRGGQTITRAEFTAMAVRFTRSGASSLAECSFPDVAEGSWMYPSVATAAEFGWILGYTDGTFRPEAMITRAEVTVIVNRMLGRMSDDDFLKENDQAIRHFYDLKENHWAYDSISEAVNAHEFQMTTDGEVWLKL